MDTKAWIAVVLCAVGMVFLYPRMMKDMQRRSAAAAEEEAEAPAAVSTDEGGEVGKGTAGQGKGDAAGPQVTGADEKTGADDKTSDSDAAGEGSAKVDEKLFTLESEHARFTFTNQGGGLLRAELLNHTEIREGGGLIEMNRRNPVPVGEIGRGVGEMFSSGYEVVSQTEREIVFETKTAEGALIRKRFALSEGELADPYLLDLDVTIKNTGAQGLQRSDYFLYAGSAAPLHPAEWPQQTGFMWRDYKKMRYKDVNWFGSSGFLGFQFSKGHEDLQELVEGLEWAGVMNQFFAIVVSQRTPTDGRVWAKRAPVKLQGYEGVKRKKPNYSIEGGLGLPEVRLNSGEQTKMAFQIYAGPKEFARLRRLGQHRTDIMNYKGMPLFGMFSAPVSRLLVQGLTFIEGKVGSYGIAIIIITILIRLLIWPLHAKSTKTMKRMSLLAPKMTELKEKYPDDPQRMNQEMMALYKEYGVNPFGGCLPVFFQLPIFLGFYRMLQSAVELRHESFLWVADLSMPDTLFTLPIGGGIPFNLLPLLMGVTMVLQMKVTPKTGDKTQQRIFMFMPLIFLVICYNFAAALALYWTTQNIFSIGQTWHMGRRPEPVLEKRKKSSRPSLMEQAQSRTKVAGQGPKQTKSRKQKRKK